MYEICNILYQWTLNKPGFVTGGCFITARKPFNTVTFSGGPGWTRTSNVSNVTVLQTVEITSYSYWPKLFSGSGGIRTHLLINHYTNLSRGRFYRPLVLHSHYISMNFILWSRWDSNPQSHSLKGWCFTIQLQDLPCAPIRTRTGTPGLKVQLTNLYPMRALPKSYWLA